MPSLLALYLRGIRVHLNPAQILMFSFVTIILIGTLLLSFPQATTNPEPISFIDALFMATSAVCVTGLSVINTGLELSMFGQIVLLALIQIGGLGFMTFATVAFLLMGKKMGFRNRLLLKESYNQISLGGIFKLSKDIVKLSLALELLGGLALAALLWSEFEAKALFLGLWHAISAFCNAGFDLFMGNSLLAVHQFQLLIMLVMSILIIAGGLGFSVLQELAMWPKQRKLSFHSRIVLLMTITLLIIGTGLFYFSERNAALRQSFPSEIEKIAHSAFMSVTLRTAGFSSVDVGSLQEQTLLVSIWFMFIGASPSSVGGGVKTTTILIILLAFWANVRHHNGVLLFSRQIAQGTIEKATMIVILAIIFISTVTMSLLITEPSQSFMNLLFEATSAFATVGLSTGITPNLSLLGKIIIIITMFVGRLGILSILFAFIKPKKGYSLQYPIAKVVVG